MSWATQAGVPPYSIPNDISAGGLAIMAIVIVICLGFLLIPVMLAGRERPQQRRRPYRPADGGLPVLGGTHRGDPRSVAPHRDEPAEPAEPVSRGSSGDER